MNRQEVFNAAVVGLASQGFKHSRVTHKDGTNACLYRSGDRRCAIGWLIKDEFYSHELEGCAISGLKQTDAVAKSLGVTLDQKDIQFLALLQHCHDFAYKTAEMKQRLRHFADKYELEKPEAIL